MREKTPGSAGWTKGLSATSIGRFGGYAKRYVHRVNGFLGVSAAVNELYAGADRSIHLGRFEPGEPWLAHTSADWTTVTHELRNSAGRRLATIYQSLLSPGVLFDVAADRFTWFNERKLPESSTWSSPRPRGCGSSAPVCRSSSGSPSPGCWAWPTPTLGAG